MAYSPPILTTLGYVVRDDTVLMCHRIARGYDEQYGKWNGLGGKLEADEDAAAGMIRELAEEADIVPTAMTLRGTLNWPGFSGPDGHVFGFVFLVTAFTGGEPPARNEEGDLVWVPRADLMNLDMWEATATSCRCCSTTTRGCSTRSSRTPTAGRPEPRSPGCDPDRDEADRRSGDPLRGRPAEPSWPPG